MNTSDDSKNGSIIPLDYAPPTKARRFGRTNFGYLAVAVILAMALPILMVERVLPHFGVRAERIEGNISVIFFDCGFPILLTVLLFSILGMLQDTRNRIAATIALGMIVVTCLL